ncbi:hypothetical protein RO21_11445 [[Actinobacillus] muris]|uniref:Type II toxin-antitoxin system RelE/ParE family toxin n=1 Tax=Muribacter muris TaxID=67855 RepID=A0A0J5P489_9PAST|nr:type II toxin-antitoxin system RelE/ParE family toxin [Muribacter muris]KMK50505.1 hypothetical protein RO21_11445 [[Actinobacillus] muris] [Muribacter muris]
MAKRWILSNDAQNNIDDIIENMIDFTGSTISAARFYGELYSKFDLLVFMPYIGRKREDGTQETFCRGYRIVYEIQNDVIYIIAVIHSRRLYPRT